MDAAAEPLGGFWAAVQTIIRREGAAAMLERCGVAPAILWGLPDPIRCQLLDDIAAGGDPAAAWHSITGETLRPRPLH